MKNKNYNPKTQAFSYQSEAVDKIAGDHSSALFDEQGLGKSKMVIDALIRDIKNGIIDCALIVCNKTLLKTWESEIRIHSHLSSIVITGGGKSRRKLLLTSTPFYLINYELVISERSLLQYLLKTKRFAIVLDESHKIKNPKTKTSASLLALRAHAKKHIIITGTPVANTPEDLWAQFYFLDNGKLLGNDYKEFKKKYSVDVHGGNSQYDEKILLGLQKRMLEISIRRTKAKVMPELPGKIYQRISVEMSPIQQRMYDTVRDELLIEIMRMDGVAVIDQSKNILKKMMRLTQIASNPLLLDKKYSEEPAKYVVLDKLLSEILGRKEKVIVWSQFVENIQILKARYKKYGSLVIHGSIGIEDRNKSVVRFQKDDEYRVLIANPAAAKEGLTLTAANNAIYLDRSFNIVDYLQSQDRIHRISQKKECNIYVLAAKNTIDEYIEDVIYKKSEIARYIQGDIKRIDIDNALTKEQILCILGGKHEK